MTEVGATATSHHRHHHYYHSAPTRPLTRSAMAMAARPAGVSGVSGAATAVATREETLARPRVSETSPTSAAGAPFSSASSVSSSSSSATTTVPAGPPSPTSPPPLTTGSSDSPRRPIPKKRAASINTEEANRPKLEHLSLTTPGTASPRPFDIGTGVCLCTPPPKVPRPRNAFILYRQHHQSEVVQQNPGLANPDISKIIGEKWREEPEERKNLWKQLAEEEKQRHQRQYPDYRYQPRRGNKSGGATSNNPHSARPTAPGEDPQRCTKCGGRYITTTPGTPSTPFMTPTSASSSKPGGNNTIPYGPAYPPCGGGDMTGRYGPGGRPVHWGSASSSMHDLREEYDNMQQQQPRGKRSRDDYDVAGLEVAKRRRGTGSGPGAGGSYHNFHALPSPPPAGSAFPHHRQQQQPQQRHASFSNPATPAAYAPSMGMRSDPGPMMPPPPRPGHSVAVGGQYPVAHHFSRGGGGGDFDESLRLPPLQTRHLDMVTNELGTAPPTGVINPTPTHLWHHHTNPHHPPPSATLPPKHNPDLTTTAQHNPTPRDQPTSAAAAGKSIEAMVMSISFLSKLRVLERISPRLASSSQRGPVVAIEGADGRAVRAVAGVVERALRGGVSGWEVRCWEDDNGMRGSVAGDGGNAFTGYLKAITSWHGKSAEITQFVTSGGGSNPSPTQPRLSTSSASSSTTTTTTTTDPNATDSDAPTPRARHPLPAQPASTTTQDQNTLPIALLPSGFSLTLADRFACAVPISDAYAPVDHWQWMATLWRGIVAADLVIYVSATAPGGGKVGEEGGVGGQAQGQAQVEVVDAGLMVVRVPVSASGPASGGGDAMEIDSSSSSGASSGSFSAAAVVVDEKMERRLGFEVVEWVRGGGWVGPRRDEGYPGSAGLMES